MSKSFLTVEIDGETIVFDESSFGDLTTVSAADVNKVMQPAGIDTALVSAVTPAQEFIQELRRLREIEKMFLERRARDADWVAWFENFRCRYEAKGYHDEKSTYWHTIREEMPWPSVPDEDYEAAMDE